ncbi:hypothetical protein BD414DRAFT_531381 [Trametes punicea]|nr:hypothetical protein BD414DRAFT_531381 [Trametes punicea]
MDKTISDRRDADMCMADFDDDDDGFFAEWPSEIASDSRYGSHRATAWPRTVLTSTASSTWTPRASAIMAVINVFVMAWVSNCSSPSISGVDDVKGTETAGLTGRLVTDGPLMPFCLKGVNSIAILELWALAGRLRSLDREVIMNNWLVNMTRNANRSIPVDLQEHLNYRIKNVYIVATEDDHFDRDFIKVLLNMGSTGIHALAGPLAKYNTTVQKMREW